MRSFELPAFGTCMLAERTKEHLEIFGADGNAAVYFDSIPEMIDRMRWLVGHDVERTRMADAARALITGGRNTYRDRLLFMLEAVGCPAAAVTQS